MAPISWISGEKKTEIVGTEIVAPVEDDDEPSARDLPCTPSSIWGEEEVVFEWNDERSGRSVSEEGDDWDESVERTLAWMC